MTLKKIFGMISLSLAIIGCKETTSSELHIEKNSLDSLSNYHDLNNRIYTYGSQFKYKYHFKLPDSEIKYLICDTLSKYRHNISSQILIPKSDTCANKIENILIRIPERSTIDTNTYLQTKMVYSFITSDNSYNVKSTTGLVENHKNLWFHPIRMKYFKVLEFSPFPYLRYQFDGKEKEYSFSLKVGSHWGDERWYKFDESILNIDVLSTYHVLEPEHVNSEFGSIKCNVVHAVSNSPAGKSEATFYFHETYGLVKAQYNLINDIDLHFELIELDNN